MDPAWMQKIDDITEKTKGRPSLRTFLSIPEANQFE